MKYSRHAKILELIEKYNIETQEELAEKLKEQGMDVTQATVSRDIKELRLIKMMVETSVTDMLRYLTLKVLLPTGFLRYLRNPLSTVIMPIISWL